MEVTKQASHSITGYIYSVSVSVDTFHYTGRLAVSSSSLFGQDDLVNQGFSLPVTEEGIWHILIVHLPTQDHLKMSEIAQVAFDCLREIQRSFPYHAVFVEIS